MIEIRLLQLFAGMASGRVWIGTTVFSSKISSFAVSFIAIPMSSPFIAGSCHVPDRTVHAKESQSECREDSKQFPFLKVLITLPNSVCLQHGFSVLLFVDWLLKWIWGHSHTYNWGIILQFRPDKVYEVFNIWTLETLYLISPQINCRKIFHGASGMRPDPNKLYSKWEDHLTQCGAFS